MKALGTIAPLFNLSLDRFITHSHLYAQEVYLPMEGACQDPVYNTWQILNMRELVIQRLNLTERAHAFTFNRADGRRRPVMMLMKRSSTSRHSRNRFDLARQWTESFTERLSQALRVRFPSYQHLIYSDQDERLMNCFACQVEYISQADVLIGVHGAGLSMMLYMPPNSVVVELAPYGNDGRCLLGGGPFSRLAAVMSHNYLIHHPPYEEFTWVSKQLASEFNISRFVTHIDSFLTSIFWK